MLQETANKEAAMATRIEEVQAELKQVRLALSNAHAEIDRLGVFSSQLKKVQRITLNYIQVLYCKISFPVSVYHDTYNVELNLGSLAYS